MSAESWIPSHTATKLLFCVRLLLMLNMATALCLSFIISSKRIHDHLVFQVQGIILIIAMLFLMLQIKWQRTLLRRGRKTSPLVPLKPTTVQQVLSLHTKTGDNNAETSMSRPASPLFDLIVDILGVVTFSVLYGLATAHTLNSKSYRQHAEDVMMMTYASIGSLVALLIYGFLAVVGIRHYRSYVRTRRQLCRRCQWVLKFLHQQSENSGRSRSRSLVESPSPPAYDGDGPAPPYASIYKVCRTDVNSRGNHSTAGLGEAEEARLVEEGQEDV